MVAIRLFRPRTALSAHRVTLLSMALLPAILSAYPLLAAEAPPAYPDRDRVLSADVREWHIDLVRFLFVTNKGLDRMLQYLDGLPGEPPKLRVYRAGKKAETAPRELDTFYSEWAAEAGYRRIIDVRLGLPPGVKMAPKHDWYRPPSARLQRTWPPEPPHTNVPFSKTAPAWERESYTWITVYHRPDDEGGAFVSVWLKGTHIWAFKPGRVPVAPILGEFLGMPWVELEENVPETLEPLGEPMRGMPMPADDGFFVKAHLGRWEIICLTRDMAARSAKVRVPDPLTTFFSISPSVFRPVRQVWVIVFRGYEHQRHEAAAPYRQWVKDVKWPLLFEMDADGVPISAWNLPGHKGGALVLFDVEDTTIALVCDGGPDPLSLLPLAALTRPQ